MFIFSHRAFLDHNRPPHPENPARLEAILQAIENSPWRDRLELSIHRLATFEELAWVHTPDYIDRVLALDGKEKGAIDPETPLTAGSVHAARLAVGLAIELVERVIHEAQPGFALLRPPGHHARPSEGMGFCIFNNIAVAAHKAKTLGIQRILILDWDVHHGNGTQDAFYADPSVFFIDLHQAQLFPVDSGLETERGQGAGQGYTLNIPLEHSQGDAEYLQILEDRVIPIAEKFRPELILVSAGFDAHENDPLGSMSVTSSGFGQMTARMKKLADQLCPGKLILFLEGGYQPQDLAENVLQCLQALKN